jgi:hypothetical protein
LCAICALALLLLGMAHKPLTPRAAPIPAAEIAAYMLPDGSLPEFCLPSNDGTASHHGHEAGTFCEACRLAGSIIVPDPIDTLGAPIPRDMASLELQQEDIPSLPVLLASKSARGPPRT